MPIKLQPSCSAATNCPKPNVHFPVGRESLKEAQLTSNAKQDKLWRDPDFDTELDGVCSNTQLSFKKNAILCAY